MEAWCGDVRMLIDDAHLSRVLVKLFKVLFEMAFSRVRHPE